MRRIVPAIIVLAGLVFSSCSGNSPTAAPPDKAPPSPPAKFPAVESMPIPDNNPTTPEGVALGRFLFYDPILSGDSTQACASCHVQASSFGDPRRVSVGIDGIEGTRQAPALANAGWITSMFWDGRAARLEDQAEGPVPNPIEMHLPWVDAVQRLNRHPTYPGLFKDAFGDPVVTMKRTVMAIAQFERTFISANSRYDRFLRGEVALTPAEERGRKLFSTERGDCFHCHNLETGIMTTNEFRRIGLDSIPSDEGRFAVTGNPSDVGKFKTPALRNLAYSAPYMHDGRFATLREVLGHYNGGFADVLGVDPLIRARGDRPLLTPGEVDTLIIFLDTLNDQSFIDNPELSNPFE